MTSTGAVPARGVGARIYLFRKNCARRHRPRHAACDARRYSWCSPPTIGVTTIDSVREGESQLIPVDGAPPITLLIGRSPSGLEDEVNEAT
jgi:hypothetical protein